MYYSKANRNDATRHRGEPVTSRISRRTVHSRGRNTRKFYFRVIDDELSFAFRLQVCMAPNWLLLSTDNSCAFRMFSGARSSPVIRFMPLSTDRIEDTLYSEWTTEPHRIYFTLFFTSHDSLFISTSTCSNISYCNRKLRKVVTFFRSVLVYSNVIEMNRKSLLLTS